MADELAPLLDRLQTLLEDNDADAVDAVDEIEARLTDHAAQALIQGIGRRIDDFEFDEALELLHGLREMMNSQKTGSPTLN